MVVEGIHNSASSHGQCWWMLRGIGPMPMNVRGITTQKHSANSLRRTPSTTMRCLNASPLVVDWSVVRHYMN